MKDFKLVLPESVDQALSSLATTDTPEARAQVSLLAGGQDLLGELKEELIDPERVVDLRLVSGLDTLERLPMAGMVMGSMVTLAALEHDDDLRERHPILAEAAASIATPQIRNVGTVGGNLNQRPRCAYYRNNQAPCLKKGGSECFAYGGMNKYNAILGGGPSFIVHPSDLAPALVALDAEVTLASADGNRKLPLDDYYTLPADSEVTRETVLGPAEILVRVTVPSGKQGWRSTYQKVRERGSRDFALSAVALALDVKEGKIADARLVLGSVAPKPWRCRSAEKLLVGQPLEEKVFRAAADEALAQAEPLEHNGYKIPMTKGLIVRALRRLAEV